MDEIKSLFGDLLIFGHTINQIQLTIMLSLLFDKSFGENYDNIEINGNVLFVEKSSFYFLGAKKQLKNNEEITQIDNFIEHYKQLLIKDEQYGLLAFLKL